MPVNKVQELETRVKELEDAVIKLKRDFLSTIYDLDENNFSRDFLKRIKENQNQEGTE